MRERSNRHSAPVTRRLALARCLFGRHSPCARAHTRGSVLYQALDQHELGDQHRDALAVLEELGPLLQVAQHGMAAVLRLVVASELVAHGRDERIDGWFAPAVCIQPVLVPR